MPHSIPFAGLPRRYASKLYVYVRNIIKITPFNLIFILRNKYKSLGAESGDTVDMIQHSTDVIFLSEIYGQYK